MTSPCTLSWRASLVYCTGGLEITSRLVAAGATFMVWVGAEAVICGMPAEPTFPEKAPCDEVPAGIPAEATRPAMPAFEPDAVPLPMPVEPTTPRGATAAPCMPPYGLPMAATVAGLVAFGLGVTP